MRIFKMMILVEHEIIWLENPFAAQKLLAFLATNPKNVEVKQRDPETYIWGIQVVHDPTPGVLFQLVARTSSRKKAREGYNSSLCGSDIAWLIEFTSGIFWSGRRNQLFRT
jgi:hypothetical protein